MSTTSPINICRFLYVGTDADVIDDLEHTFEKLDVTCFDKSLYPNQAIQILGNIEKKGLFYHFILIDKENLDNNEVLTFYNRIKTSKLMSTSPILVISPEKEVGTIDLGKLENFELKNDPLIRFYTKPVKAKILIDDLVPIFNESYGNKPPFELTELRSCNVYTLPSTIDITVIKQIKTLCQDTKTLERKIVIFNFKNTTEISDTNLKNISKSLVSIRTKYPTIHAINFQEKLRRKILNLGLNHVLDTKHTIKTLLSKQYHMDPKTLMK